MEETRDGRAGLSAGPSERADPTEPPHGVPGVFGALLDEALGHGLGRVTAPERPPSDPVEDDTSDVLPSSLIVAVRERPDPAAGPGPVAAHFPASDLGPAVARGLSVDVALGVEAAGFVDPPPAAPMAETIEPEETGSAAVLPPPAGAGTLRPTTVDGRIEFDVEWMDRPLLSQPLVLKPGASVGPPDGGSYIANPGSIPVTFVPAGTGADPAAGSYFVDPAEVAAAAGPGRQLTAELMARLSGHPYQAGPPTAIQLAILDAARQAGLRLGPSS